jgi:hypothetical protein
LREFWEQPEGADLDDGLSMVAGGAGNTTRLTEISITTTSAAITVKAFLFLILIILLTSFLTLHL